MKSGNEDSMTFMPKHILIPVALAERDDFEIAEQAMEAACNIAERFKAKLSLLYVSPHTNLVDGRYEANNEVYKAYALILKQQLEHGKELISRLEKTVLKRKIETHIQIFETDQSIPMAICQIAEEQSVDLIIMGSHARKGLKRFLLGSVASQVTNISQVPVLLLKPKLQDKNITQA
jgi:nucleotide-binding universal stress UspA family protein